ncbi:MAG TPA: site-specific DNA-methyltransferase [Gemmatimonadaceae bacterium]|nr:site-specific DNA-methyltransferase [Gemmatimonadaceae bacterium]
MFSTNSVVRGDAREVLKSFPDNSVDCVVTSPPYYLQRDYGGPSQIGCESSPEEYVGALVSVFEECRRILKTNGTFWLNLGDKYFDGQLLGMPWRVALALQSSGWLLRSDIIWHKANAMPSSVRTRPTTDHEYVFFFSRAKDYFYDADAVREPHITFSPETKMRGGRGHFGKRGGTPEAGKNGGNSNLHNARWDQAFHPNGRNRRTVWRIPLSKFPDAHFAVFPEDLVEVCLKAGCPKNGIVLDPFLGSGTTAVVAQRLSRNYVGIDSNEDYCRMSEQRLASQLTLAVEG